MNRLRKNGGFSLLEVISILVITSLIGVYATESVMKNINNYTFYSKRHLTQADARQALNHMVLELRNVDSSDITAISATSISFKDDTGTPTNFQLSITNGELAILRGNKVVVDQVNDFTIKYYNDTNVELIADISNIPFVRRIGISIKIPTSDNGGEVAFKTIVVPRSFVGYADYLQN